jgi:hypothetical protein
MASLPNGPNPYQPPVPGPSALRALYSSVVQVTRLTPSFNNQGGMGLTWQAISAVPDVILNQAGLMACRLDIGFLRPGKDQPAPLVAGRPPDRVGVCYYDPVSDAAGQPVVLAGDRLVCVSGPVIGTWELRNIPDPAVGFASTHHIEVQVIEVSQALAAGSITPFPGSAP